MMEQRFNVLPYLIISLCIATLALPIVEAIPRLQVREGIESGNKSVLRVNRNVTISCIDCISATWLIPNDCETVTNRTVEVVIRCETSGVKTFSIESEDYTVSFRLRFVRDDYHCFAWTACALDADVTCRLNTRRLIDQSSVDYGQVQMLVQVESVDGSTNYSRNSLTKSLVAMGELPEVSVVRRRLFPQSIASDPVYSNALSGWIVNVSLDERDMIPGLPITLRIEGRSSFLMGCFVQQREISFRVAKFPLLPSMDALPFSLKSVRNVVSDPCAWDLLYAMNQNSSAMLLSHRFVGESIAFNHVSFGTAPVAYIAPVRLGVVVLAGSDIFRLAHDSGSPTLMASGVNVAHLSSARSCRRKVNNVNDMVIAWSAQVTNVIHVSAGQDLSFESIAFPTPLEVLDALPLFGPTMLLVLAKQNDQEVYAMQYDLARHMWTTVETFTTVSSLPSRITTPRTPSGEVYAYGQRMVWASGNYGRSFYLLNFVHHDGDTGALPEDVKQIETSGNGRIAVLTETNRIFLSQSGLNYGWECISPLGANASFATLQYDMQGKLWALYAEDDSSVQRVRVFTESMYPAKTVEQYGSSCPYFSIRSKDDDVLWLDKSENVTVEVLLEYSLNNPDIRLAVVRPLPSLIDLELQNHGALINYNLSLARQHATMTFTAQEEQQGVSVVRSLPTDINHHCDRTSAIFHVNLGCPEGRHLRLKHNGVIPAAALPSSCVGQTQELRYKCHCQSYNGSYYNLEAQEGFEFDVSMYGCPIALPYTRKFSPTLEIWDGDIFVRQVSVDYVIFETNGRTNAFSYMLTSQSAGCLKEPDAWQKKNKSLGANGWMPSNYESCFEAAALGGEFDWTMPYEIMTSKNAIRFSSSMENAPLLFTATVVDPDYSYCTLQTRFAVHPYGMPHNKSTTLTIVSVLIATVVASLGASYLWYRHELQGKKPS